MALVNFLIPIRHPDNVRDEALRLRVLERTMASIAAQTSGQWRAIVACNPETALPAMPTRFEVVHVDVGPNVLHDGGFTRNEEAQAAVRLDKGRRLAPALARLEPDSFFMMVDDDDFVSRRIVAFVEGKRRDAPGWHIERGYHWWAGERVLRTENRFHKVCGTSIIMRVDRTLLHREGPASEAALAELGSHSLNFRRMTAEGAPLAAVPFRAAVYRRGHPNARTRSNIKPADAGREGLPQRALVALRRAVRIRPLRQTHRDEFFAGQSPA